jgi:hypothetical protein
MKRLSTLMMVMLFVFVVTLLSTNAVAQNKPAKIVKPSVVYGEIVSVDLSNKKVPQVVVKDTRSGKNVKVALESKTRILKTVYLNVNDLKKGEPARVIYKEQDGNKVASMVFVREAPKKR